MAITKLDPTKRYCRMGGQVIPKDYPSDWCWRCLRSLVEGDYSRTYYQGKEGYWEEVPELTGAFPISEKGKAEIRKVMKQYQKAGKITTNHE